ncbi:MAG: TlpA family protein disulfide reductase [Phycisphaerales bacterium]|jgi:thiol-disulfide isomerase/thioredoxin|nr:TlpA family protein disulfide reductase [Phycisphaerales bacterium]
MIPLVTCALSIFVSTTTPKEWLDPRLDTIDREAIEEMISFALPPFHEDIEWVLPEDVEPPVWSDHLGKVIVIQTWSNQTASGRVAPFAAEKVINKLDQKDEVFLVSLHTPLGVKDAKKFMNKRKLRTQTAIDTTGLTCNMLGVHYDPVSIVVDRNGAVRHVGLRIRGLTKAIESLLEEEYDPTNKIEPFVPKSNPVQVSTQYPPFSDNPGRATDMQGKRAPTLSVTEWISEPVDVTNKVRVIEFWATWCGPCKKTIPHLNDLAEEFSGTIEFVGISGETAQKVASFQEKTPMHYGVAVDPKKTTQNAISCRAIPLALVISSDNIVRWQGNPSRLTATILKQVVSADSGETETVDRGRWKPNQQKKK